MVENYYCLDLIVLEGMSQLSRRLEVCKPSCTLTTTGYLLALLLEILQCPRAPTITVPKQARKTTFFLYRFQKWGGKLVLTFRTQELVDFVFEVFKSTLNKTFLLCYQQDSKAIWTLQHIYWLD